jgi:hypothetical protein
MLLFVVHIERGKNGQRRVKEVIQVEVYGAEKQTFQVKFV